MRRLFFVGVLVIVSGCGSSPTGPSHGARVEQFGELTITCGETTCTFTGTAVNVGTATAFDVTGVTTFGGSTKRPVALATSQMAPGASAAFTGTVAVVVLPARSSTEFDWRR